MTVYLTDDEVIAVAGMGGSRYDGPLPTVALSDEEQALAATWRGQRSLGVRDLLGENGALVEDLAAIAMVYAESSAVELYSGNDSGARTSMNLSVLAYYAGDWVLFEETTPGGVHSYDWVSPTDAVAALSALLASAEGAPGVAGDNALLLGLRSEDSCYARIDGGAFQVAGVGEDGGPADWKPADLSEVQSRIRVLLAGSR